MDRQQQRPLKGFAVFGLAYERMLERWPKAPGSVEDVLDREMVLLAPETASELYRLPGPPRYQKGTRPELEHFAEQAIAGGTDDEGKVRSIAQAVSEWHRAFEQSAANYDYDNMRFGGTEESILARGSDNCAEVARLACALFQVAGLPARLGIMADTENAYSGHVICEVFYKDTWGAVDAETNVVYQHPDGRPANLWELHCSAELVERHMGPGRPYTGPGPFPPVAISHYDIADADQYDYTEVPINDYVRTIWKMGDAGWPGGLRWLFGEDGSDAT